MKDIANRNTLGRGAAVAAAAVSLVVPGITTPADAATPPAGLASAGVAGTVVPDPAAELPVSASAQAILAKHGIAADDTSPPATITGTDTFRSQQWGYDAVNAPSANTVTTGGNVVVAVIDTGVAKVSELSGRVLAGTDLIASGDGTNDQNGHGTGVASIIAATANNGAGLAGIAPSVRILPVRVCGTSGCPMDSVAAGIIWAVDHGAQVLNLSLGGGGTPSVAAAVKYADDHNVAVAASVGNSALEGNPVLYPGAYDTVVGTGAIDSGRARASFSEYGPQVDIAAPGVGIVMAAPGEKYVLGSGTSQASPHVAAAMALAKAYQPSATPAQIRDAIATSATDLGTPGRDDQFGAGLLDAAGVLKALGANPGTPAPSTAPAVLPVVSAITPVSGTADGGTVVKISGTGFANIDTVRFGDTPATSFTVLSTMALTAVAPPGAGAQPITVTTSAGTSINAKAVFTYRAPLGASFTATPVKLAGGVVIPVTVTGGTVGATAAAFAAEKVTAKIGGVAATVAWVDASHLKVTVPASVRSAAVTMQLFHDGVAGPESEATVQYLPAVTAVSPQIVSTDGGTTVTITGSGFAGVDPSDPAAVTFGDVNATSFTVKNPTTITAVAPAGVGGAAPVKVTTGAGVATGQVRYRAALGTTVPDGTVAKASGGTVVTLTVTGGTAGATAKEFAAEAISALVGTARVAPVWVDATHLKVTLPASAAASVTVTLVHDTVPGPATTINYVPVVTSMSATTDTVSGGKKVTIRVAGNGIGSASFTFGDKPATCTTQAAATFVCTAPAAAQAGPTWVSFTTGTGATSRYTAAATFSYTDLD